jgi:gamma-hexachlorocyclohexane dehydrochlorinase
LIGTGKYRVGEVEWSAWNETHHIASNNHITFSDSDHATSVCDVDCRCLLAGEQMCQIVGAPYADQVERREGVWWIAGRKVGIHYFDPVPGAVLAAPES